MLDHPNKPNMFSIKKIWELNTGQVHETPQRQPPASRMNPALAIFVVLMVNWWCRVNFRNLNIIMRLEESKPQLGLEKTPKAALGGAPCASSWRQFAQRGIFCFNMQTIGIEPGMGTPQQAARAPRCTHICSLFRKKNGFIAPKEPDFWSTKKFP